MHMETYRESPDPSFPVCDTESDPRWGWLGLACETMCLSDVWGGGSYPLGFRAQNVRLFSQEGSDPVPLDQLEIQEVCGSTVQR